MTAVADTFDRANGNLVGSAFSDGSGLVWAAGSGTPTISGNRVIGSGFGIVNLRSANNTVSAYLWAGGQLLFRYVDANNYYTVSASIWNGQNADVPPVNSYGYTWVISRIAGGSVAQTWSFQGGTDYMEWSGHAGYPAGVYDPGHVVTVTLSGNSVTVAAQGGTAGTGGVSTASTNFTNANFNTATKYGVGGPADSFSGTFVETAPTAPTVTAPNGGETINASTTVTWTASSDAEGDAIVYDLDYTRDNGSTWTNVTTGISGTSYAWNTAAVTASTVVRVRVRARDTFGLTSAYDESNANFTIAHAATVNVWNGSAFVAKPVFRWDGTQWSPIIAGKLKRWNGSAWVNPS